MRYAKECLPKNSSNEMKSLNPIPISGVPGSPYTRKMLSLMRYRRIPYAVEWGDPRAFIEKFNVEEPKPVLLPVMIFEVDGKQKAITDSTPIIRHLEDEFPERGVIPSDPKLAFLNYVLEDFGDEWVTKFMFHYRWYFQDDIEKAGTILPLFHDITLEKKAHQTFKQSVSDWQTSRLWVVGSNETTAPIIEASYKRFLGQLEDCLSMYPFLFGSRPSSADYAIFGQLSALIGFDPTSRDIAHEISPRVVAWQDLMEDMSGLEPSEGDWITFENAEQSLSRLFEEVSKVYIPALLANSQAFAQEEKTWTAEIDGVQWEQRSFPYQVKCLQWINDEFQALDEDDQQQITEFLNKTGCKDLIIKD
jgi:glutathione S-transferase